MPEAFPLTALPDWGLSVDPTADVLTTKLGDGYTHRRAAGLNHLSESWSPTWSGLTREEADSTYTWLKARLKLTAFLWDNPLDGTTYRVVCDDVRINHAGFNDTVLSAKFDQDFNIG